MSFLEGMFVFLIAWWLAFFMSLPIGVKGQHEDDEGITKGTEPGAPRHPMLVKKMIFATIGGLILTLALYFAIDSGIIDVGYAVQPKG